MYVLYIFLCNLYLGKVKHEFVYPSIFTVYGCNFYCVSIYLQVAIALSQSNRTQSSLPGTHAAAAVATYQARVPQPVASRQAGIFTAVADCNSRSL